MLFTYPQNEESGRSENNDKQEGWPSDIHASRKRPCYPKICTRGRSAKDHSVLRQSCPLEGAFGKMHTAQLDSRS